MSANGQTMLQQQQTLSRRDQRRADRVASAEQGREDRRMAREEQRLDRAAQAEQRRRDEAARTERERVLRGDAQKERARKRRERNAKWQTRRRLLTRAVLTHVPLTAIPVVLVSLVMGWTGQARAALALGMGVMAYGIPVLTEGMVLTLAVLTAHAIDAKRPYKVLLWWTWGFGVFAAAANAAGHLIEDASPAGMYRAVGYAVASLSALLVWAISMMSKRAVVSGAQAAEIARWRRLRRSHPRVAHRARRISDLTGMPYPQAWALAWERRTGASTTEPTIGDIRTSRRAAYRRGVANRWDGRRWRDKPLSELPAVPAPGDAAESQDACDSELASAAPAAPVTENMAASAPTETPGEAPKLWVPPTNSGYGRRFRDLDANGPAGTGETVPGGSATSAPGTPRPATGYSAEVVPSAPEPVLAEAEEIPFLSGIEASNEPAKGTVKQLSARELRKAAAAWHKIYKRVQTDKRYRSPKGHLGVSPYAVARALSVRHELGPDIVKQLIEQQLIPVDPSGD